MRWMGLAMTMAWNRNDGAGACRMRPIVLTTLGRTGSNWTVTLLGAHPAIVVHEPQRLEPRYASYWMQLFLNTSRSMEGVRSPADFRAPFALLSKKRKNGGGLEKDDAGFVRRFCLRSLEACYARIASAQQKEAATFFCEKFLPDRFTETFLRNMSSAVEIFLVRDFRDMMCSIGAFNRKRGSVRFGRERFGSDADYVVQHVGPAVTALRKSWQKRRRTALMVRYEDLVLNPRTELRRIFRHIGVDFTDTVLDRVQCMAASTMPDAQKAHKTSRSPEMSIGRYRTDFSPELLKLCNTTFKKALKTFGYCI